jgi:hypothetical protein
MKQGTSMKPITHWIGQYLLAASTMFGLLLAIDVAQGTRLADAWPGTLAWSAAAAAIFVGSRYRQARKGADCTLCKDDK